MGSGDAFRYTECCDVLCHLTKMQDEPPEMKHGITVLTIDRYTIMRKYWRSQNSTPCKLSN